MPSNDPVVLILYIDSGLSSARALYRWLRLLEAYTPGALRFLVRDIGRGDDKAEADADGITAIPTLVVRGSKPERLLGDLSNDNAEWLARAALARAGLLPTRD